MNSVLIVSLNDPAVLKVKINKQIELHPPGSGPKPKPLKENVSPCPPLGPSGGRGDKTQIKSVLKYS